GAPAAAPSPLRALARREHVRGARPDRVAAVTSLDTFRTVASVGAALGIVAILAPATGGRSAAPRRAAGLATTVAAWALLARSLVTTHDLHRAADKLHSPRRPGAPAVAAGAPGGVGVLPSARGSRGPPP